MLRLLLSGESLIFSFTYFYLAGGVAAFFSGKLFFEFVGDVLLPLVRFDLIGDMLFALVRFALVGVVLFFFVGFAFVGDD